MSATPQKQKKEKEKKFNATKMSVVKQRKPRREEQNYNYDVSKKKNEENQAENLLKKNHANLDWSPSGSCNLWTQPGSWARPFLFPGHQGQYQLPLPPSYLPVSLPLPLVALRWLPPAENQQSIDQRANQSKCQPAILNETGHRGSRNRKRGWVACFCTI